jgi:predicted regulator of Ras-like GTPase activity (Roadblock/LC7/MglB family)
VTKSVTSPLEALLTRLSRIDGVVAAALTTADGLPVAATGRASSSELAELRSATVAAIFGAVDRALPGLGLGHVNAATLETTSYTVYMVGLRDLVLSAVAEPASDRETIRAELARVAGILSQVNRRNGDRDESRSTG